MAGALLRKERGGGSSIMLLDVGVITTDEYSCACDVTAARNVLEACSSPGKHIHTTCF
jgi:hypothetical protein